MALRNYSELACVRGFRIVLPLLLAILVASTALAQTSTPGQNPLNPTEFFVDPFPSSIVVNPVSGKVYVPTPTGLNVLVGKSIVSIPITGGVTQVVINPSTGRVYAINTGSRFTNVTSNQVTVIDDAAGTITASISLPVSATGGGLGINILTNRIFVSNGPYFSLIDGASNALLGSILAFDPSGQPLGSIVVDPTANMAFIAAHTTANPATAFVVAIDTARNTTSTLVSGIPMPYCCNLSAPLLAINPVTHRLYIATDGSTFSPNNVVYSFSTTTGASLGLVLVSNQQDIAGLAVDTVRDYVHVTYCCSAMDFSSAHVSFSGNLQNYSAVSYRGQVLGTATFDSFRNLLYSADPTRSAVNILDGSDRVPLVNIRASLQPVAIANSPETQRAYVVNAAGWSLSVINDPPVVGSSNIGQPINRVAVDAITNKVFATGASTGATTSPTIDGGVFAFSGSDSSHVDRIATPSVGPIAIDPIARRVYAGGTGTQSPAQLFVVNEDTYTVSQTISLTGRGVSAVAVNPFTHKIYAAVAQTQGNSGYTQFYVIDGTSSAVTPIGAVLGGAVSDMIVNPATNTIYAAVYQNGSISTSGSLAVIDGAGNTYSLYGKTFVSPESLQLDSATNTVYLMPQYSVNNGTTSPQTSEIDIFSGARHTASSIPISTSIKSSALNPLSHKMYLGGGEFTTSYNDMGTYIVDLATKAITQMDTNSPLALAIDLGRGFLYSTYSVFDTITDTVVGPGLTDAGAIAVNQATGNVYGGQAYANDTSLLTVAPLKGPVTSFIKAVPDSGTIATNDYYVETSNKNPAFTVTAYNPNTPAGAAAPSPSAVYYGVDTITGPLQKATESTSFPANPAVFAVQLTGLTPGAHTLYAYSAYGSEDGTTAPSTASNFGNSPQLGQYTAYSIEVAP